MLKLLQHFPTGKAVLQEWFPGMNTLSHQVPDGVGIELSILDSSPQENWW